MLYISKRQKVMNFLVNQIVPNIKRGKDPKWLNIDIEKLCSLIQVECGVSEKMAIECLKAIMKMEELIVIKGILTIPEEKEVEWIKKLREEEKIIKEEGKEVLGDKWKL